MSDKCSSVCLARRATVRSEESWRASARSGSGSQSADGRYSSQREPRPASANASTSSSSRGWRPGKDIAGLVVRAAADGSGPAAGQRVVGHPPAAGWAEHACVFAYTGFPETYGADLAVLVRLVAGGRLHPEIGRVADWA
jgi:hypothetical protein